MSLVEVELRVPVAADVMSTPAIALPPDASVWAAWSVMSRTGLRHIIIAVDGRCVGMVDDRVVFAQWPMGPLALRRHSIGSIMRTPVAGVLPETGLRTVAAVMMQEGADAVPVVDEDGAVVGIVTTSDITAAVAAEAD